MLNPELHLDLLLTNIRNRSKLHPKQQDVKYQYGTAGFRTLGTVLDSVLFRVGILAALRSKCLGGKTIGVMVTASHNPEPDNGVKLVDPLGEMLETSWESHATVLANASSTEVLISKLVVLISELKIDISQPARVVYARDTRPSGLALVQALEDGLTAMCAEMRNAGVTTTPILHYLVRTINTKGIDGSYGDDTEQGYYTKLSNAFNKLLNGKPRPPLIIDCANGVGALAAKELSNYLGNSLPMQLKNTAIDTQGVLNNSCGADFVKVNQKLPPSLAGVLQRGQRACSLDGDADRLIYCYLDEKEGFHMLDGDKIAILVATFIAGLVKKAGVNLTVAVVQTAYANGNSTNYLSERLVVSCVPTGVKHLHHEAGRYDIGVYFEANGHGTVLFSSHAQAQISSTAELEQLRNLIDVINQTVGDALSDMLLVEAILALTGNTTAQWDNVYTDLPNRLVKVVVQDRNVFETEDAERRLVNPPGLQAKIDELVKQYDGGRSFVRPSGTEDVVRVYAEASLKPKADELAFRVAGLVYDAGEGDPSKRPTEFL